MFRQIEAVVPAAGSLVALIALVTVWASIT